MINQLKVKYLITTAQGDYYTTGCLLDYNHFKKHYKMIATDLSKLDADPKSIQHVKFTGNLDGANNRTMFFIINKLKQNILDFSQGTVKVL